MKIISINPDKCVGCRLCELACSLKNAGEFNPSKARIQVAGAEEVFSVPVMCFQCEEPNCLEVCPANAIKKDPATGVVKVTPEKCSGCKTCTLACPFGNIAFSSDTRKAVKCEQCDGEPECVAFCPTGALSYVQADTAVLHKKRRLAERLKGVYEGVK